MFDGHHQPVPSDAMPRRFLLELTRKLDKPKGRSTAPVLKAISEDLEAFYGKIVEHLTSYVPPAPKLPKDPAAPPSDHAIASPSTAVADAPAYTETAMSEPLPTPAIARPAEAVGTRDNA